MKTYRLSTLAQALALACAVLLMAIPFSCKITEEGIQIVGGDYAAPVLENVTVVDSCTVRFDFSEAVKLSGIVVSPRIAGISDSARISENEELAPSLKAACGEYGKIPCELVSSEDNCSFTVLLLEETKIGQSYEVYGTVEDEIGNSLTFCVPFNGYNGKVPRVIMTELQIKYGKGTLKGQTVYRGEFIEFLALEDGNLSGLVLESAADGHKKDYEFPVIDVKKGEVFLVHFRTVGEGCVNEIDDDVDAATAPHSANNIRDLWSEDTNSHFNDSNDVIILRDTVNNVIMDGVMYALPDSTEWKATVADYAFELEQEGLYASADIENASSSKGATPQKSLTRTDAADIKALIDSADDYDFPFPADSATWAVTGTTPGSL